jgi:hypothetical protein
MWYYIHITVIIKIVCRKWFCKVYICYINNSPFTGFFPFLEFLKLDMDSSFLILQGNEVINIKMENNLTILWWPTFYYSVFINISI